MLEKRETVHEREAVERMAIMQNSKSPYEKPALTKHENLKDLTFECPDWQCSVVVPPPPEG